MLWLDLIKVDNEVLIRNGSIDCYKFSFKRHKYVLTKLVDISKDLNFSKLGNNIWASNKTEVSFVI